jgi:hypothetical protein
LQCTRPSGAACACGETTARLLIGLLSLILSSGAKDTPIRASQGTWTSEVAYAGRGQRPCTWHACSDGGDSTHSRRY